MKTMFQLGNNTESHWHLY